MRCPDLIAKSWTRHFRETCGHCDTAEHVVEVFGAERRTCLACGRTWLAFYAAPGFPNGQVRLMPQWEIQK